MIRARLAPPVGIRWYSPTTAAAKRRPLIRGRKPYAFRRSGRAIRATDVDISTVNVARDADGTSRHSLATIDGQPVAREREALDDIEQATGSRPYFTPKDKTNE